MDPSATPAFLAAIRGEAAFPYSFEEDARALNILRAAERGRRVDIGRHPGACLRCHGGTGPALWLDPVPP